MQKLDLNALDSLRPVVEKGGQSYPIRPITPRIMFLAETARSLTGLDQVRGLVDTVAALVPDMTRADVEDMSLPQLYAIIEFASQQVHDVEAAAADPNGQGSAPASGTPTTGLTATPAT